MSAPAKTFCKGCNVDRGKLPYDICTSCGTDLIPAPKSIQARCGTCAGIEITKLQGVFKCDTCGTTFEAKS